MELEDHNCWTIAEAARHRGPHRLQHLCPVQSGATSRSWTPPSAWAVSHLDDGMLC